MALLDELIQVIQQEMESLDSETLHRELEALEAELAPKPLTYSAARRRQDIPLGLIKATVRAVLRNRFREVKP